LKCFEDLAQIRQYLRDSARTGDVIMTIGAGDICEVGLQLAADLQRMESERSAGVDLERITEELNTEAMLFPE